MNLHNTKQMKYLVIFIVLLMASCRSRNGNDAILHKMQTDFKRYYESALIHIANRNLDSAYYYRGRMAENDEVQMRLRAKN